MVNSKLRSTMLPFMVAASVASPVFAGTDGGDSTNVVPSKTYDFKVKSDARSTLENSRASISMGTCDVSVDDLYERYPKLGKLNKGDSFSMKVVQNNEDSVPICDLENSFIVSNIVDEDEKKASAVAKKPRKPSCGEVTTDFYSVNGGEYKGVLSCDIGRKGTAGYEVRQMLEKDKTYVFGEDGIYTPAQIQKIVNGQRYNGKVDRVAIVEAKTTEKQPSGTKGNTYLVDLNHDRKLESVSASLENCISLRDNIQDLRGFSDKQGLGGGVFLYASEKANGQKGQIDSMYKACLKEGFANLTYFGEKVEDKAAFFDFAIEDIARLEMEKYLANNLRKDIDENKLWRQKSTLELFLQGTPILPTLIRAINGGVNSRAGEGRDSAVIALVAAKDSIVGDMTKNNGVLRIDYAQQTFSNTISGIVDGTKVLNKYEGGIE